MDFPYQNGDDIEDDKVIHWTLPGGQLDKSKSTF